MRYDATRHQTKYIQRDIDVFQNILTGLTLTHRGRVTHICVGSLTINGSDNGLSPGRRQAIIWTNDGILLIGTLGTNVSEIWIEILTFLFKKIRFENVVCEMASICLGLNELTKYSGNIPNNKYGGIHLCSSCEYIARHPSEWCWDLDYIIHCSISWHVYWVAFISTNVGHIFW